MNISLKNLKGFRFRKKQKDSGISLARATRGWLTLFFGMFALLGAGVLGAMYIFFVASNTNHVVITDPVDTVRYQSADIQAALLRYDALREHFIFPSLSSATMTQVSTPSSSHQKDTVATSTPVRVE
jgi:hypothetical protein